MDFNIGLYLFLFFSRVVDVSLGTIRTLLLVRGRKVTAAIVGFFEVIIYVWALKAVVQNLDNSFNLFIYASGFAAGNIIGGILEEKMALGNLSVKIITRVEPLDLAANLRGKGFGVTVVTGEGRDGPRYISHVMLKRKDFPKLLDYIENWDDAAFVTVSDCRSTKGGFLALQKK